MSRQEFFFGARTLPSPLSADMKAKIDQSVAEGRVTRVAPGESGLPKMRWNGEKLVYVRESGDHGWMRQQTAIHFKQRTDREALKRARAAKRSGNGEGAS